MAGVLTIEPAEVLHRDLAVAPHGAHDRVQLLALHAPERDAEVLSVDDEAQRALVHVEHDEEDVGHDEALVGAEQAGVRLSRLAARVVVQLVAAEVPAPRLAGAADQRLVADAVERGVARRHADDGVRAALARAPVHLPRVQAARVADAAADAVGALSDRVPVERQLVVVLHEDVQRAVVAVPRVLRLHVQADRRHVEQHVQPARPLQVRAVDAVRD